MTGLVVASRKCDLDGPTPGGVEAKCSLGCNQCVKALVAAGFVPKQVDYPSMQEMLEAYGLTGKN